MVPGPRLSVVPSALQTCIDLAVYTGTDTESASALLVAQQLWKLKLWEI